MNILRRVPSAVLWLVHVPSAALDALRTEAAARGVSPARLVISPYTTLEPAGEFHIRIVLTGGGHSYALGIVYRRRTVRERCV
eukprot:5689537-Pyramimonas_sp.AAC.1